MKVQDGNSTHAAVKEIDVDVPAQELPAISPRTRRRMKR